MSDKYKSLVYYVALTNMSLLDMIVKQLNGFFERLVQHECDHLDGIVFLEKVKEHNGFATLDRMVTKLSWLIGNGYKYKEIKKNMITSFRGEIETQK